MQAKSSELKRYIFDTKNRKIAELVLANKEMSKEELLDLNIFDIE